MPNDSVPAFRGSMMRRFDSDGLDIAFFDRGRGEPILLIHGFGTTAGINWLRSGWADLLAAAGRRVVGIDNRGHGESTHLYDPSGYRMEDLAGDACRLLDHLGIEQADVMGYSMGSRIAALLALDRPARVRSLILGGIGTSLVRGLPPAHEVADALTAETLDEGVGERARLFRQFVDRTGGNRMALAACMRSPRAPLDPQALSALSMPILIAIGTRDTIAGPIGDLARFIPQAELFDIPDRDHMRAVGDAAYKERVLAFLRAR